MNIPNPSRQGRDDLPSDQAPPAQALVPVPAPRPPPVSPRGKAGKVWAWLGAGALGLIAAALLYLQPWAPAPMAVAVEPAALAPVTRVLAVNGQIAALHSVDVRSLVGGSLTEVAVAEGEAVTAGQILARVDSAAQEAVVRQAMAVLDAALVAQEQADAAHARALALGATISATARDAALRAAQSAAQEVARAAALLEQARVQLARHSLLSPITGSLIAMEAEPGQIVDQGTVLMTVADLTTLVVETDVDETYARQIAVGQPAVLRLAGEAGTRAGQVRSVAGRVDVATGGLAVKIGFDDPVSAPIGLTVTANIVVDRQDAALTVPRTAIVTDPAGTSVFLARDGVARQQPVRVIDWPAVRLIVTGGLAAGDPVIRDATGLQDGQPIRVDAP